MFGLPIATAQDLPAVKTLTWSERIKPGDSYKWTVNEFSFNGTPVTDNTTYGLVQGSTISLSVDVQLSDVNVAEYLSGNESLPDVGNYATILVDGSHANISIFHPGILILPTNITLEDGTQANALWAASFYHQVFFSAQNKVNYTSSEYIEYNTTVTQEEFVWDLYLGVLKTIKIHWNGDLNLEVNIVNPEQFNTKASKTPISSSSNSSTSKKSNRKSSPLPLFTIIVAVIVLPILRQKLKYKSK